MNIITVIPLTKTKAIDTLSYFTASNIPIGAIVTVPIRSKNITSIVIGSVPAEDAKTEIRGADYTIRKLGKVRANNFFSPVFVSTSKELADYYATTVGSVIRTLTSKTILDNIHKIKTIGTATHLALGSRAKDETYAIQGDDEDRMSGWRSLIRQEFARKKSVAIYVPTIEDVRNISSALTKGIEDYIFTLHSELTPKKTLETWEAIARTEHPVVIIATASFASLPRKDIETMIIERENGRGWITRNHPYIDMRHALETLARRQRLTVYLSDSLLRIETLYRLENHEIAEGSPFKWKSISTAQDQLIDMRATATPDGKRHFKVLSEQLEKLIESNRDESGHLFILTGRRGLASLTVCDDCETIVSCKECSAPVVLHASKENGRNFFMCHNCGARRSADEMCANCTGWRLTALGVGTERVSEEIKSKFDNIDIINIDADTTKTEKQITAAMQKFLNKPGSILIGTEMALKHISEPINHIAIASIDSLLSLPDFRIQERMMYALIRLRSLAKQSFVVQTRKVEEKVFEYGIKGNLGDYYRNMIRERKQFSYPPFSLLIKISIEGKKELIAKEMANIQTLVSPQELDIFPAFTSAGHNKSVIHGLIKIPIGNWPLKEIAEKLRILPQHISVKIDPESLL